MAFYQQFHSEFLAQDTDGSRDFVSSGEYLQPVTPDYMASKSPRMSFAL